MQNYKKISDLLANEQCKGFVTKLLTQNPAQIALQYRDKIPCDASVLAYLIKIYQKAIQKLPLWVDNYCILTTKSYEQSTSQIVALYKTTFIQGEKLLVLGGGLGVDEWAFANTFNQITSIDNDADLNDSVAYNHKIFGIENVERRTLTAEDYLNTNTLFFDAIYTDPDRRDEKGKRIKTLKNSTPNIIALLPQLWQFTNKLIIKASPLIDIPQTIKEVGNVAEVRVIAQNNEVKEILLTAEKNYSDTCVFIAANFDAKHNWQELKCEKVGDIPTANQSEIYFYEPNVAIIKAGLSHQYACQMGLGLVDEKTFYYTGATAIEHFMGRKFTLVQKLEFSKRGVANYLKQENITKANIAQRNFRLKTDEIKKMFTIKDGGEHYLFFTQQQGKPLLFHCIRADDQAK